MNDKPEVGSEVKHETYGIGKIVSLSRDIVEVLFDNDARIKFSYPAVFKKGILSLYNERLVRFLETLEHDCILSYLKGRGVEYLVHFTRSENLDSILENGILPRASVPDTFSDYFNDSIRYDNNLDCGCYSISFPNYRMLFPMRMRNKSTTYAILLISIDCLKDFSIDDMLFYRTNAASLRSVNVNNTGLEAVDAMFEDNLDHVREEYNLPDYYTTDPQAEVQLRGIVKPEYIKEIYFDPDKIETQDKACKDLFYKRMDSEYWSSH